MNATRILLLAMFAVATVVSAGTEPGAAEPMNAPSSYLEPELVIAAHNSVRHRMGVPPVAWSDELARVAQNWADILLANGQFAHSRDHRYGENLYEIRGGSSTPYSVVSAWASEAANYQYATNSCSGVCGHYTQVMWRDTKQVGCGVAHDQQREIWVCNYAPFGNIIGEKPY